MVYSRAERVFILEHYFASKLFAAAREAFSNAILTKKYRIRQQCKISGQRKCFSVTSAHRATKQLKLWPCRLQAVRQLQEFNIVIGFAVLCVKEFT
jgi:hypothetical protein